MSKIEPDYLGGWRLSTDDEVVVVSGTDTKPYEGAEVVLGTDTKPYKEGAEK